MINTIKNLSDLTKTALKIIRKRVVSPEAQTRTNEAKITVKDLIIKIKNERPAGSKLGQYREGYWNSDFD